MLDVDGRSLSRADLEAMASDEAEARAGRWVSPGRVVPVAALLADRPDGVTHATFLAADGYAASVPIHEAVADGVVIVPAADQGRVGVRLVVDGAGSACFNVKAVTSIELDRGPGKHTVDPNPHENAFVPGWDAPEGRS